MPIENSSGFSVVRWSKWLLPPPCWGGGRHDPFCADGSLWWGFGLVEQLDDALDQLLAGALQVLPLLVIEGDDERGLDREGCHDGRHRREDPEDAGQHEALAEQRVDGEGSVQAADGRDGLGLDAGSG